ncbi:phage portal protein [Paludisphaera soli]|uniref:phage portal protein n=1 Tax=Paludisphaera soli TaxID=2712865 RepID=UPI0013EDF5A1|nr:phage portal protein [Paludisphaera soli]
MRKLPRRALATPASLLRSGGSPVGRDDFLVSMRRELYGWGLGPDEVAAKVNVWGMLGLATARRCIEAISRDLASMPLNLVRVRDDDTEEHDPTHPLYSLFRWSPDGGLTTPIGFRTAMTANALAWGNGYGEIATAAGRPQIRLLGSGTTDLAFREGRAGYQTEAGWLPARSVLHVAGLGCDGVRGFNPVRLHAHTLGLTVTAERFGAAFLANGAFPSGYITADAAMGDDEEAYIRLREAFIKRHAEGVGKAGRVGVLPPGFGFTQASVDPEVAQFLETREFQILEICRIFGVPPHRVMQYKDMHYSTVEAVKSEFAQTTLLPWARVWEESLNLRLLGPDDVAAGWTFRHDFTGFLRADTAGRAVMYRTLFNIGAISPNEVRAQEGYDRRDGGDEFFTPLAMSSRAKAPAAIEGGGA